MLVTTKTSPTPSARETHTTYDARSLEGLTLVEPSWNSVAASQANFAGSVITGREIFENCNFSGSCWAGAKFCQTTGQDPFSGSYDATLCTNQELWTTFRGCNFDGAIFGATGRGGIQGVVAFDKECILRGSILTGLGPQTAIRIGVLDQLGEAVTCRTVKPGDDRVPSTEALMEERAIYVSQCEKEAKDCLRGMRWDRTLIEAAGDRGAIYSALMIRLSRH
jgi:hypothetical protein